MVLFPGLRCPGLVLGSQTSVVVQSGADNVSKFAPVARHLASSDDQGLAGEVVTDDAECA